MSLLNPRCATSHSTNCPAAVDQMQPVLGEPRTERNGRFSIRGRAARIGTAIDAEGVHGEMLDGDGGPGIFA